MPRIYEVAVTEHTGPPNHHGQWAIAVIFSPRNPDLACIYGISSSPPYTLKAPESITLSTDKTYQGHVLVGEVNQDKLPDFSKVLGNEDRLKVGNSRKELGSVWGCEEWVMECLRDLKAAGHPVREVEKEWLSQELAKVTGK